MQGFIIVSSLQFRKAGLRTITSESAPIHCVAVVVLINMKEKALNKQYSTTPLSLLYIEYTVATTSI